MTRTRLSDRVGTALDPCAAIQVSFDLAAGEEREIVFRLGAGRDTDDARNLVNRFRWATAARTALDVAWQQRTHALGAVNVETRPLTSEGQISKTTQEVARAASSSFYKSHGGCI